MFPTGLRDTLRSVHDVTAAHDHVLGALYWAEPGGVLAGDAGLPGLHHGVASGQALTSTMVAPSAAR